MKKRSLTAACLLVTLTLALCLNGAAQKGVRTEKAQAGDSLEMSLDSLEQALKESAALDFRQRYPRTTYTRLKRRGGCDISFQVSLVPGTASGHEPSRSGSELSYSELRMSLSDLDAAGVEVYRPETGDYSIIRFATLGGKEAIKSKDLAPGDVRQSRIGRLYVGENVAPRIVTALQQAITACKK
jgi:hypothetical protein